MKRYTVVKEQFFKSLEKSTAGIYKQKAYFHSIQVSQICMMLARERDLDVELSAIIGLFHDYSQFIRLSSFNHAKYSSEMVLELLKQYPFTDEEINIIVDAIKNHSDKDVKHDNYSELIKDADLLVKYYDDPSTIFKPYEETRIKNYIK